MSAYDDFCREVVEVVYGGVGDFKRKPDIAEALYEIASWLDDIDSVAQKYGVPDNLLFENSVQDDIRLAADIIRDYREKYGNG